MFFSTSSWRCEMRFCLPALLQRFAPRVGGGLWPPLLLLDEEALAFLLVALLGRRSPRRSPGLVAPPSGPPLLAVLGGGLPGWGAVVLPLALCVPAFCRSGSHPSSLGEASGRRCLLLLRRASPFSGSPRPCGRGP